MKAWYVPSWNGDVRVEPSPDHLKRQSIVSIVQPTPAETIAMASIIGVMNQRGWTSRSSIEPVTDGEKLIVDAPIEQVGPLVVSIIRPGAAVLTVMQLKGGGKFEVVDHSEVLTEAQPTTVEQAAEATETALAVIVEETKPEKVKAVATVKRPTPCCPDCYVGPVNKPATQSLLAFFTKEQHKTWARDRYIVCRGGLSHHEYIVAHRSSEIATKNSRICWDATDKDTLHFHDQSVPPEEEVLATMLILQHREHWLRNEATCFGIRFTRVFKNPFGNHLDGVEDATLTRGIGLLAGLLQGVELPLFGGGTGT